MLSHLNREERQGREGSAKPLKEHSSVSLGVSFAFLAPFAVQDATHIGRLSGHQPSAIRYTPSAAHSSRPQKWSLQSVLRSSRSARGSAALSAARSSQ